MWLELKESKSYNAIYPSSSRYGPFATNSNKATSQWLKICLRSKLSETLEGNNAAIYTKML